MKKIIFFTIVVCHLSFVTQVFAVSATESAAQSLLDRVATKVATLAQTLKRGAVGEITSIGAKSFDLENQKVLISEATTYYRIRSGVKSTIEFKNLNKGDDLAVIGTSDTTTGDITARQIIAKVQRLVIFGKVTNIDKKKNIYTLVDKAVEIDTATVVKKTGTNVFVKAKYTDIAVGDNLITFGYYAKPGEPLTTLKAIIVTQ